jgi:hypothetical protein
LLAEEATTAPGKHVSQRAEGASSRLVRVSLDQRHTCVTGRT